MEKGLEVSDATSKSITLTRPFAQVNIGTNDLTKAADANIDVTEAGITVSKVYTQLNFQEDDIVVIDKGIKEDVTFALAELPTGEKFPVAGYDYLTMNYLLMPNSKETLNITINYNTTVTEPMMAAPSRTFSSVPVQQNYRTNIFGNLLTSSADYTVTIDPEFGTPGNEYEVDKVAEVTDETELANAIDEGKSVIILGKGEYTLPASAKGKELTFVGTGDPNETVIKAVQGGYEGDYSLDGSTAVFENLTITVGDENQIYNGFVRCTATYKNCIINHTLTLYGTSVFENCTFNVEGDAYNVWTWGQNATFTNCTFDCDGKSMLVYGYGTSTIKVEGCTFNDNGTTDYGKAAIETGNDYNATYHLIVDNTTVNGFAVNPNGIPSGNTLWANKNSMDKDHLSVTVDGVKVY